MNRFIRYIFIFILSTCLAAFHWSCMSDDAVSFQDTETSVINFRGYTGGGAGIDTRANDNITDITSTYYNGVKFHIYMKGETEEENISSYLVPSSYSGTLIPAPGEKTLNWFNRKGEHNFWSWTTPWITEEKADSKETTETETENEESEEDEEGEEDPETGPVKTPPSTLPFTMELRDTYISETTVSSSSASFPDNSESWKNGAIMEQCVGTRIGGLKYIENGQFVPLQYRHLMSKIFLAAFVIIDNSTATTQSGLKGNITFYGIPKKATFYPAETDVDGNPVSPHFEKDPKGGDLTFAITNTGKSYKLDNGSYIYNTFVSSSSTTLYDCWYIWPEVDFSEISFKIEIYENVGGKWRPNQAYGQNGAFYGDFRNIKFSRSTSGNNYDDYPTGTDDTVLHAGEYLLLSFNLNTKGNPSISGSIYDWSNTTQNREASKHDKDGIYSVSEAKGLSDVMNSGDEEKMKEYFETFGSSKNTGDDPDDPNFKDELDIFYLYDDIGYNGSGTSSSGQYAKMASFYVADGYIVDGTGHIINVNSTIIKIGHIRNVYLRYYYSNNEYIVYIDKEGLVWLVDPETYRETPTEFNVNDMDINPFSINLRTGQLS